MLESNGPLRTVLHDWHTSAGAKMHGFGGFDMPIQYDTIFSEHIATRSCAGLFDVSHMGRFLVSGSGAVPFLQYTLTNNVLSLDEVGMAQYTLIPDENGAAVDDAYLYRIGSEEYLLVVNAANRDKDWEWLSQYLVDFSGVEFSDRSDDLAMIALQGPESEAILETVLGRPGNSGRLPEPFRNRMSMVDLQGTRAVLSRTGYTGEPVAFELFPETGVTVALWEQILEIGRARGVVPVGLGARDTLRLETGLPLYGHELGEAPDGSAIPVCALSLGRRSTSFAGSKGEFVGRDALLRQNDEVVERLRERSRFDVPLEERLVPRLIRQIAILNSDRSGPAISSARQGDQVHWDGRPVGWITSGTIVPYIPFEGEGLYASPGDEQDRRAVALAYVDSALVAGKPDEYIDVIKSRNRSVPAVVVSSNLQVAAPFARGVVHPEARRRPSQEPSTPSEIEELVSRAVANTRWRQREVVNLIPSEQTPSLLVRLLSVLDPAGRYAEHRAVRAFGRDARDVFYYQGTGFIEWAEASVQKALSGYLGCSEVEVRAISGQMANKAVFSGTVDYVNRFRRGEPRRLNCVVNNHLGRGGHLSAQYMGALRHFVGHDPVTDRPAVLQFPVCEDNPYRMDVESALALIEAHRPELVILGKSMVLHPEPVRQIAEAVADWKDRPIIMYDMAHVLGLVGDAFQHPFQEGADLVTGSTHKTFFGPQRGIIASNMSEFSVHRPLWEQIDREVFPGDVSNHHLGTLLALLGATYEMVAFRDVYQAQVIANAKAFAQALCDSGLTVEGDPSVGYTETHQVILNVGRGLGPDVARRLEASGVITNYQALPTDASFSDASGIRTGVQEMTRFGMLPADFGELAEYVADIVLREKDRSEAVHHFRSRFTRMEFCLPVDDALVDTVLML